MTLDDIREEIFQYECTGLTPSCVYIGRKDYDSLKAFARQHLIQCIQKDEYNQVLGLPLIIVDRDHYLSVGFEL